MPQLNLNCILVMVFSFLAFAGDGRDCNRSPLRESSQVIVSLTPDWTASQGKVQRFEREGTKWKPVDPNPHPAVIGRNGMAWGKGLLRLKGLKGEVKHEGDGKSPAGIFLIFDSFGYGPKEGFTYRNKNPISYHRVDELSHCVDDPDSKYYNQMVYDETRVQKDWSSSERLRYPSKEYPDIYKYALVVDHNGVKENSSKTRRLEKAGSCIFIHVWKGSSKPTEGCTAFEEARVKELVEWLDKSKRPLLIQLPAAVYAEKREEWCLPSM